MKIEVKETYDNFDMTGVVAVITEGQWHKLIEVVKLNDKGVLLDILGNDKTFLTEDK